MGMATSAYIDRPTKEGCNADQDAQTKHQVSASVNVNAIMRTRDAVGRFKRSSKSLKIRRMQVEPVVEEEGDVVWDDFQTNGV